jgi:hypothetical protein
MTNLIETEPELPGTVIVKGKSPLKLLAVVHDVSLEPIFKEKWIRSALHEVFKESEKRKVRSLALPMIGTLHGSLKHKRFIEFLKPAIEKTLPKYLKSIWLITPPGINKKIIDMLKSYLSLKALTKYANLFQPHQ